MVSSGEKNYKYFIGYKDDDYKIKLLCIMLPKTSAYEKRYGGETIWINFLIKYAEVLRKYTNNWIKVSNSIKKDFNCEPVYIKIFLETKLRTYVDEATDFHSRKIPQAGSIYSCWLVIIIDSVLNKDKNYYLQVFLKECKYIKKVISLKRWLVILLIT